MLNTLCAIPFPAWHLLLWSCLHCFVWNRLHFWAKLSSFFGWSCLLFWVKSSFFLWVRSSFFFGLGRLHFLKILGCQYPTFKIWAKSVHGKWRYFLCILHFSCMHIYSNFVVQNVALTNFGVAIHQQSNEAISSTLATPYGVWRCRLHLNPPQTDKQTNRQTELTVYEVAPQLRIEY